MNVGLCTISGRDRPVEEVLSLAGAAGYDGVEIWGGAHVGEAGLERCREIAEAARENDLAVPTYGSYLRCATDGFETQLDRDLSISRALGADLIRLWAGRREYGEHDEAYWERAVSDLRLSTERAAAYGLCVTVEKHANTLTNDLAGARALIEAVGSERCRLNYQPGFGIPPTELEREARVLAPLSNQLHLQATGDPATSERVPLTGAYYDLEAVLEPFLDRGFDGYANVEFVAENRPYREAITDDLEHLRTLLDA